MDKKVALLTGGSSGIGYESAKALARRGYLVYAAARRVSLIEAMKEPGVRPLAMDLTDEDSLQRGVQTVIAEQGRIDALVNNAGYGYLGAIEAVSLQEARRQLEVNLFGLARLSQLVLPYMRAQGGGRIVNVSSVAGKVSVAKGGWYTVSKFAVEALSDSLRIEMKPFGVQVVLIEPGPIRTDWGLIAADHLEASSQGTVYEASAAKQASLMRYAYKSSLFSGPQAVRRVICKAVCARRPRLRYRPGRAASLIVALHALLPARWWDAGNRWLFG